MSDDFPLPNPSMEKTLHWMLGHMDARLGNIEAESKLRTEALHNLLGAQKELTVQFAQLEQRMDHAERLEKPVHEGEINRAMQAGRTEQATRVEDSEARHTAKMAMWISLAGFGMTFLISLTGAVTYIVIRLNTGA